MNALSDIITHSWVCYGAMGSPVPFGIQNMTTVLSFATSQDKELSSSNLAAMIDISTCRKCESFRSLLQLGPEIWYSMHTYMHWLMYMQMLASKQSTILKLHYPRMHKAIEFKLGSVHGHGNGQKG